MILWKGNWTWCMHARSPGAMDRHIAVAHGEQLSLAQGSHLSRGIEGGRERWLFTPPQLQSLPDLRLEPASPAL